MSWRGFTMVQYEKGIEGIRPKLHLRKGPLRPLPGKGRRNCYHCDKKFHSYFCRRLLLRNSKIRSVLGSKYECLTCHKRFKEIANFLLHRTLHELPQLQNGVNNNVIPSKQRNNSDRADVKESMIETENVLKSSEVINYRGRGITRSNYAVDPAMESKQKNYVCPSKKALQPTGARKRKGGLQLQYISSRLNHSELSDGEGENDRHPFLHDQFKMAEENETPTVFIIPGDNEMNLNTNGRLDDSGESLEPRPLFDERSNDFEDGEKNVDHEATRSDSREHSCSCTSCKNDRSRHERRRTSDCHSHCSHHGSYHGDCSSDRCHSHKESHCRSDSCHGSHCSKSSDHGGCHHSYHDSHRQCHDQFCSGSHCHSSHCHGDSCYPKFDWREYFMNEDDHRFRNKMYKHMYSDRFHGDRHGHRNPFDSYPPPVPDGVFMPPDPLMMNYNQRRGGQFRPSSAKDKPHHPPERNTMRSGAYSSARKHSESDLAPLDAASLTKNATGFKGRRLEGDSRHPARGDILTAPGSAIRRMKELVSKYSDRQGRDGEDQSERLVNMPLPPELAKNEEAEMQTTPGDQMMEHQMKPEAYVCHICGKEFAWAITLKRHMLIHTGVRQYQCSICNKAFTRSHHLKRHMTVHTGEKPYVCHICNKAYSRSDRLSSHMNNHEGYVSNKKRGRIPAKSADNLADAASAATVNTPESTQANADLKMNAGKERDGNTPRETEGGQNSREIASGERAWGEAAGADSNSNFSEIGGGNDPWNASIVESGPPTVRVIANEPLPWYSQTDLRSDSMASEEGGRSEQFAEDEVPERRDGNDFKADTQNIIARQEPQRMDDDTLVLKPDVPVPMKHSPHFSKAPDHLPSSSSYQSFALSRGEKETLAKFNIHSPEMRPPEFRPPEFFPPPGYPLPGPPPGPGFIPGNILDANPKDGKMPPYSGHAPMYRHDEQRARSPLGHDLHERAAMSFMSGDPGKFAFSSLLNARSEFINKQRMSHASMLYHDLPSHETSNRDGSLRQDQIMMQKPDDRDGKFGNDLPGNYLNSRKEDGPFDDSKNEHASVSDESSHGMQSKFKVQLASRDSKVPMDMKPPEPHMNLFTFRHMVHQPGRQRAAPDNSGQKRVLPRTFVCRTCNKAFTRSHHLRRHELIHSGQKPFKCTICGRAFNRTDHLNLHLATHYQSANGPRPYNRDPGKGKKKDAESPSTGQTAVDGEAPMETREVGDNEEIVDGDNQIKGEFLAGQSAIVGENSERMAESYEIGRADMSLDSVDKSESFAMESTMAGENSEGMTESYGMGRADLNVSNLDNVIKSESGDRFDINSSI